MVSLLLHQWGIFEVFLQPLLADVTICLPAHCVGAQLPLVVRHYRSVCQISALTVYLPSASISSSASLISLQAGVQSCCIHASVVVWADAGFPRLQIPSRTCNKERETLASSKTHYTLRPCYPVLAEHSHLSETRPLWCWILVFGSIKMKCRTAVIGNGAWKCIYIYFQGQIHMLIRSKNELLQV